MSCFNGWEERAARNAAPQLAKVARARETLDRLCEADLEAIAEAAIAILDERRDPDEDHCLAGDEGCGLFIGSQRGGAHWGSEQEAPATNAKRLSYGIDQREIMSPWRGMRGWVVD